MRTLIIDNYDSFTHNLAHLLAEINQEEPLIVRNNEFSWAEISQWGLDNIVISPGPGRPDRIADFGVSMDAIRESPVPVLGVCLGCQGIAIQNGGAVHNAVLPIHGKTSLIWHNESGLFQGIPSPFSVARYHSLIVTEPLPETLLKVARTDDGLLMALAHRDRPQWGVQFHPESVMSTFGQKLLTNFRDMTHRLSGKRTIGVPSRKLGTASVRSALSEPIVREVVARWVEVHELIDTEATFVKLFAESDTAFWLDSSLMGEGRSRWSYLGDATGPDAALVEYKTAEQVLTVTNAVGKHIEKESIFSFLDRNIVGVPVLNAPPCPFAGGYIGWLGYELRNECGSKATRKAITPDALLIKADRYIAVDHIDKRTYVIAISTREHAAESQTWVDETCRTLKQLHLAQPVPLPNTTELPIQLRREKAGYLSDITQALEWIGQGEAYQVCLTNEITLDVEVDAIALYRGLRSSNPAPYAAFIRWPGGAVLSASPEGFLRVDASRRVETKPIKGTIGRSANADCDKALAELLRGSEKDRAENMMIVDLLRNDLSRVCTPGSVFATTLCELQTYATVHTLVSTIQGQLRMGATIVDLLQASFPGGSVTGVPKVRALELIDQLEQRARGVYTGTLGWFGYDGTADLSLVIRTIVATAGRLSIGVGGGIVAQSTPEGEYAEMMLKAHAMLQSVSAILEQKQRK